MQLKVTNVSEKDIMIEVEDEDIAIAHVVHKHLLQNENVVFAGVAPYHPLIKKSVIRLQTKKGDPVKAFVEGSEEAANLAKKISTEINKALKTAE
ncbi:MAG: hypothetical protein HYU02_00805 [Thaumarchaeota archaeon]|nr:hypothetical protein [Nitrososphaerota archaeon]